MRLFLFAALLFSISAAEQAFAQSLDDFGVTGVGLAAPAVVAGATTTNRLYAAQTRASFNGVMVRGTTGDADPAGWVQFEGESEWHPLTFLKGPYGDIFLAGYRSETYRDGGAFTLRFETELPATLALTGAGVFDNRNDADRQPPRPDAPPPVAVQAASQITPPTLINRAEWGANRFIGSPEPLARPAYTRLTFHHAAGFGAYSYEEGVAQVKAIQVFHQNVRGWSDIGYQFVMDQEGRIYQGRPFLDNRTDLSQPPTLALGAHVGGFNTGNIGVSVLGCFHPPEGGACSDVLSPAAYDSLTTMFAYLSETYQVSVSDLLGHRDQGATACPGDNNYQLLPQLRDDIQALIASGNQPIAAATLEAEPDEAGVVVVTGAFTNVIDVADFWIARDFGGASEIVFRGTTTGAFSYSDTSVPAAGAVSYQLFAESADGRVQRLATAPVALVAPASYRLHQNFPNPVTSQTTIRYYVERDGIVRLEVYAASGRRVHTLVDAFQDGERWYTVPMETAGLASGAYFYRLTVEGFAGIVFDATRALHVVR